MRSSLRIVSRFCSSTLNAVTPAAKIVEACRTPINALVEATLAFSIVALNGADDDDEDDEDDDDADDEDDEDDVDDEAMPGVALAIPRPASGVGIAFAGVGIAFAGAHFGWVCKGAIEGSVGSAPIGGRRG